MQCACAILSSVAIPALQYFYTVSHKQHDSRKNVTEHKMCISFFIQLLSEIFLILRRTERHVIINIYWSSYEALVIRVRLRNVSFLNKTFEK
jgi:hypothetical protein